VRTVIEMGLLHGSSVANQGEGIDGLATKALIVWMGIGQEVMPRDITTERIMRTRRKREAASGARNKYLLR